MPICHGLCLNRRPGHSRTGIRETSAAIIMEAGPTEESRVGTTAPTVRGWAQIDTGADVSCIAQDVVDELAMTSVSVLRTVGAGGHETRSGVYALRVKLFSIDPYQPQILPFWTEPVVPMAALDLREERHGLPAVVPAEIEAPMRSIALLGRDFLREFQFTYSGPGSYFTLAY